MQSVLRQARVRVRDLFSEPADPLTEEFEAAGLTETEQHVLRGRLAGRSFAQLAGHLTRQRVQQIEAEAVAKLGIGSLAEVVHTDEREERRELLRERGRRVKLAELRFDPATTPARRAWVERWEIEHEARVSAFLAGCA